jgi:hypothetical protein
MDQGKAIENRIESMRNWSIAKESRINEELKCIQLSSDEENDRDRRMRERI